MIQGKKYIRPPEYFRNEIINSLNKVKSREGLSDLSNLLKNDNPDEKILLLKHFLKALEESNYSNLFYNLYKDFFYEEGKLEFLGKYFIPFISSVSKHENLFDKILFDLLKSACKDSLPFKYGFALTLLAKLKSEESQNILFETLLECFHNEAHYSKIEWAILSSSHKFLSEKIVSYLSSNLDALLYKTDNHRYDFLSDKIDPKVDLSFINSLLKNARINRHVELILINILGKISENNSIDILVKLLNSQRHEIVALSAYVLGLIKNTIAAEPLLEICYHDLPEIRYVAAFSLCNLNDKRAAEPLLDLVKIYSLERIKKNISEHRKLIKPNRSPEENKYIFEAGFSVEHEISLYNTSVKCFGLLQEKRALNFIIGTIENLEYTQLYPSEYTSILIETAIKSLSNFEDDDVYNKLFEFSQKIKNFVLLGSLSKALDRVAGNRIERLIPLSANNNAFSFKIMRLEVENNKPGNRLHRELVLKNLFKNRICFRTSTANTKKFDKEKKYLEICLSGLYYFRLSKNYLFYKGRIDFIADDIIYSMKNYFDDYIEILLSLLIFFRIDHDEPETFDIDRAPTTSHYYIDFTSIENSIIKLGKINTPISYNILILFLETISSYPSNLELQESLSNAKIEANALLTKAGNPKYCSDVFNKENAFKIEKENLENSLSSPIGSDKIKPKSWLMNFLKLRGFWE